MLLPERTETETVTDIHILNKQFYRIYSNSCFY